jgi:RHS repeat-associated protein
MQQEYFILSSNVFSKNSNVSLYSFNGKEKDDEWNGTTGGFQDYGMRIYDTRVCRFLSIDPFFKSYPWYTPYSFAGNKPIWAIDLDGLEEYIINNYYDSKGRLYKVYVATYEDVNGKARNVHLKINGKAETTQKVKIIDHYVDKKNYTSYADELTESQKEIYNNRYKTSTTQILPKHGSQYKESDNNLIGDVFKDGTFNVYVKYFPPQTLDIVFNGGEDKIKSDQTSQAQEEVKELAEYMKANPTANVTLIGNTGGKSDIPDGADENVYKSKTKLNGQESTVGKLMDARTAIIKQMLIDEGIDSSRISTERGSNTQDVSNRKTEIKITDNTP